MLVLVRSRDLDRSSGRLKLYVPPKDWKRATISDLWIRRREPEEGKKAAKKGGELSAGGFYIYCLNVETLYRTDGLGEALLARYMPPEALDEEEASSGKWIPLPETHTRPLISTQGGVVVLDFKMGGESGPFPLDRYEFTFLLELSC